MSNVLGTLFQDIADAIRAKTGDTDTMKPAEFPAEIASIVTGGIASGAFKYKSNTFNGYSGQPAVRNIVHGLGVVPDILIVIYGNVPSNGTMMSCVAFTSKMLEALGGGWLNRAQIVQGTSGAVGATSNIGADMDQGSGLYATYGGVRNVTATAFDIGSDTQKLPTTGTYRWIAIGGITG